MKIDGKVLKGSGTAIVPHGSVVALDIGHFEQRLRFENAPGQPSGLRIENGEFVLTNMNNPMGDVAIGDGASREGQAHWAFVVYTIGETNPTRLLHYSFW